MNGESGVRWLLPKVAGSHKGRSLAGLPPSLLQGRDGVSMGILSFRSAEFSVTISLKVC